MNTIKVIAADLLQVITTAVKTKDVPKELPKDNAFADLLQNSLDNPEDLPSLIAALTEGSVEDLEDHLLETLPKLKASNLSTSELSYLISGIEIVNQQAEVPILPMDDSSESMNVAHIDLPANINHDYELPASLSASATDYPIQSENQAISEVPPSDNHADLELPMPLATNTDSDSFSPIQLATNEQITSVEKNLVNEPVIEFDKVMSNFETNLENSLVDIDGQNTFQSEMPESEFQSFGNAINKQVLSPDFTQDKTDVLTTVQPNLNRQFVLSAQNAETSNEMILEGEKLNFDQRLNLDLRSIEVLNLKISESPDLIEFPQSTLNSETLLDQIAKQTQEPVVTIPIDDEPLVDQVIDSSIVKQEVPVLKTESQAVDGLSISKGNDSTKNDDIHLEYGENDTFEELTISKNLEPQTNQIEAFPDVLLDPTAQFSSNIVTEIDPLPSLAPTGTSTIQTEVFDQIVERMQFNFDLQYQEVKIQLKPEHLGEISVKIAIERGIVNAEFVAENQAVRETLAASLPQLRVHLEEAGIQLGDVNVGFGNDPESNGSNFNQRHSPTRFGKNLAGTQFIEEPSLLDGFSQINLRA